MFMRRFFNFRTTTVVLLALILSAVAYGFAAANTINGGNDTYAGEGSGAISGYDVIDIQYTLDSNYPSNITAVQFDLQETANTVRAGVDDDPAPAVADIKWADSCSNSGTVWTCTFSTNIPTTLGADNLYVIASQ